MSVPELNAVSTSFSRLRRLGERVLRDDGQTLFALFKSLGTQVLIIGINVVTGVITARLLGPEPALVTCVVSPGFDFADFALAPD